MNDLYYLYYSKFFADTKYFLQMPAMFLLFKNYSVIEVIYVEAIYDQIKQD